MAKPVMEHACVVEDPAAAMCWRALCSMNSFTMRSFSLSTVQMLCAASQKPHAGALLSAYSQSTSTHARPGASHLLYHDAGRMKFSSAAQPLQALQEGSTAIERARCGDGQIAGI